MHGHQSGFTLTEIMVVLAIIGLATAMGAATFLRPKEEILFKQDLAQLQDALLSARNAAFTRGQCAFVTVQNAQNIEVKTYTKAEPCAGPLPTPDLDLKYKFANSRLSQITTLAGAGSVLIFNPRGGTTVPQPVMIKLSTSLAGGRTQRLVIYPAIGQVRQE